MYICQDICQNTLKNILSCSLTGALVARQRHQKALAGWRTPKSSLIGSEHLKWQWGNDSSLAASSSSTATAQHYSGTYPFYILVCWSGLRITVFSRLSVVMTRHSPQTSFKSWINEDPHPPTIHAHTLTHTHIHTRPHTHTPTHTCRTLQWAEHQASRRRHPSLNLTSTPPRIQPDDLMTTHPGGCHDDQE